MSGSSKQNPPQRYDTAAAPQGDTRPAAEQRAQPRAVKALRRGLKGLRAAEDFRLWARFVLSPDEAETLRHWALADGSAYGVLVSRYRSCRDQADREGFLDYLREVLEASTKARNPAQNVQTVDYGEPVLGSEKR